MNFLKKLWRRLQASPEQKRQREILWLWRATRDIQIRWLRLVIPHPRNLWLWLWRRVNRRRRLAGIAAAAKNARMASWRARQKPLRRISNATATGRMRLMRQKRLRLCRRRCRLLGQRVQTRLLRWLVIQTLCLCLWLVLLSLRLLLPLWLGRKKCSRGQLNS